jgi:23S rRNA (pseudouridine1915-N3)-methyltransferase
MMLDIFAVCRRPSESILALCKEYEKRLPKNFPLRFTYLAPSSNKQNAQRRKAEEGTRLLKNIPKNCYLICLDSRGTHMTSASLAAKLQILRDDGRKIAIVIGGADGVDESVLSRSEERWSLSKLTFPHKLVQIILSEQIYRAWSISEGLPYHRV